MTKICNIKLEIKYLEITIDKTITIQVLNFFNLFFAQFLGILSYKAKEKEKLTLLKNLTKFLEDEKL